MSNFSWKGSVDSLSGVATFYPHTKFSFDVNLNSFKEAQEISNRLKLAETESKQQMIDRFKGMISNAADALSDSF